MREVRAVALFHILWILVFLSTLRILRYFLEVTVVTYLLPVIVIVTSLLSFKVIEELVERDKI